MLGYVEDGPNLVLMAMNGWGAAEPAWWLNLQDHPEAVIDTPGGSRRVRARAARPEEHDRLWAQMRSVSVDLDRYAAMRPRASTLVVLEPVPSVESRR